MKLPDIKVCVLNHHLKVSPEDTVTRTNHSDTRLLKLQDSPLN